MLLPLVKDEKSKRCFNVKFSIYCFYMKTKILANFKIKTSVALTAAQNFPNFIGDNFFKLMRVEVFQTKL